MAMVKDTIWLNDNVAAQVDYDLLAGIEEELDKYVKAVEKALPKLPVEDGTLRLQEVWIETALPYDLLAHIIKHCRVTWPANVERVRLRDGVVPCPRPRPEEEEAPGL